MKKIFKFLFIMICFSSFAQDDEQTNDSNNTSKVYFGVGAGVSFGGGDLYEDASTGVHLTLINFGVRFSEEWGATLNLHSFGHKIDDLADSTLGIGALTVGPMYTASLGENLKWEIKPQIALSVAGKQETDIGDFDVDKGNGFVIGNSLLFGSGNGFQVSANLDFVTGKITEVEGIEIDDDNSYSLFNIGIGLRYNF